MGWALGFCKGGYWGVPMGQSVMGSHGGRGGGDIGVPLPQFLMGKRCECCGGGGFNGAVIGTPMGGGGYWRGIPMGHGIMGFWGGDGAPF